MGSETNISWTKSTWNPLRGCSRVSEGCRFCYAEVVAARFSDPGMPYEGIAKRVEITRPKFIDGAPGIGQEITTEGRWTGEVRLVENHLHDPLRWKKPRRIFVNSMSDLFHEKVPDEWIDRIFAVMALAPQHTFQVLTKRPERMRDYMARGQERRGGDPRCIRDIVLGRAWEMLGHRPLERYDHHDLPNRAWPLRNVWLGVSCEDQETADERVPILLDTPAAIRFVSAEPLLDLIDFSAVPFQDGDAMFVGQMGGREWSGAARQMLSWIIVGGESGRNARPCNVQWIYDIVQQCKDGHVSCFVKQLGSKPFRETDGAVSVEFDNLTDRKGADPTEWPEDLRVQEFPA